MNINRDSQQSYNTQNREEINRNSLMTEQLLQNRQGGQRLQNTSQYLYQKPVFIVQEKKRLTALDIHRGLTMVGMILVDNSGPYPFWVLQHSQWDGVTPADMIFPSFIFIMGMAVPLAVNSKNPLRIRNFLRVLGLFLIGQFLNLSGRHFDFTRIRYMGILQRLSLTYAVLLIIHFITKYGEKSKRIFGALIILIMGATYLSLMLTFENLDIDCPKQKNLSPDCNFAGYVDRTLFGKQHIIPPTDPQGLFSTLSAILTGYGGYIFSLIMFDFKGNTKKILISWIIVIIFCGAISYPLTFLMPFNKKIWSISFAFLNIAIAGACLTFLVIIFDNLPLKLNSNIFNKILKIISSPFVWLGRNPLAIFFLMDALAIILIIYIKVDAQGKTSAWSWFYKNTFGLWIDDKNWATTCFSLFFVLLWTAVAGIMYRMKLFIRL